MGFESLADLDCDTTTQIGGVNKETKKPNPKSIEGYFLGTRSTEGKFGISNLHILKTSKGNIGVWGKSNLDGKLRTVPAGTMVRITFDKLVPSNKGNDMWKYKVEVDKDNTIEVATADAVADDTTEDGTNADTYNFDEEETSLDSEETSEFEAAPPAPVRKPSKPAAPVAGRAAALLGNRKAS